MHQKGPHRGPFCFVVPSRCCAARPRSRRSSAGAAAAPPRRRRARRASSSTWIAFIGSTYGLRSRIDRWTTGWRSSSSSRLDDRRAPPSTVRSCSAESAAQKRSGSAPSGTSETYASRDLEARLRERHLEVLDERPEERPLARRGGGARPAARPRARRRGAPRRSRTRPAAGSGSASRRTPTGSPAAPGARRSPPPRAARPGREPISSSASSSTGVKLRKKRRERRVLPDERRGRRLRDAPPARPSCPARPRSAARGPATAGNAVSSVADDAPPRGCAPRGPGGRT